MLEYHVVEARDLTGVVSEVNAYLERGWLLQGGIIRTASTAQAAGSYAQALTRTRAREPKPIPPIVPDPATMGR